MSDFDKTGLDSREFDIFSETSKNRYYFICNMRTDNSRWSKKAVEYFGLPDEYMHDALSIWSKHIHPDDLNVFLENINALFCGKSNRHNITYRAKNRDGEYVLCDCNGIISKGENGLDDLFAGTITNYGITDNIDSITNLPNFYEMVSSLNKIINKKLNATVLAIKINDFSDINTALGYVNCNIILKDFAKKVYDYLSKKCDIFEFYRGNGVKFYIILKKMSFEEVNDIYSAIKDITHNQIYINDEKMFLALSAGVLNVDSNIYNDKIAHSCVNYALDISRYEENGRLVLFDPLLHNKKLKNFELLCDMRNSISTDFNGFYLVYQPIINNGKICEVEALIRWKSEKYGIISPNEFISWLETDPSFYNLGNWILRKAMSDFHDVVSKEPDFVLNINIAYPQLENPKFKNDVLDILNDCNFPAKNLCLELTERCRTLSESFLSKEVAFFKKNGIKIAIDDFGTGFSAMGLLKSISFDYLKIDKKFIVDLLNNKCSQSIIDSFMTLAQNNKYKLCVEGIENVETLNYLDQYSYDDMYYQGYYFSKPVDLAEIKDKINNK